MCLADYIVFSILGDIHDYLRSQYLIRVDRRPLHITHGLICKLFKEDKIVAQCLLDAYLPYTEWLQHV
jgi:DNA-directed RNA polymerase specialized sigma subunit